MAFSQESSNLDLLRSFAVCCVLFDHSLQFFDIGKLPYVNAVGVFGVFLFFVHTSLVLMMSLERHDNNISARQLTFQFYLRRFFRIYPASAFFLGLTLLFKIPSSYIAPHHIVYVLPYKSQIISNFLLIQNLIPTPNIIGPYWSLPIEVQMYLFIPFLFFLVKRCPYPLLFIGLWILAAAIGSTPLAKLHYLKILFFIPNFFGGIIAYSFMPHQKKCFPPILFFAMLCVFTLLYMFYSEEKIVGWCLCLAVGVSIPFFREIKLPSICKAVHTIAKYSYGIYILHNFCIWFAFEKLKLPLHIQVILWILALLILPVTLYHLIEAPGIQMGNKLASRFAFNPTIKQTSPLK
jgi:peptidoglycan/LPS O-acetylase OafA/YrhL